LEKVSELFGDLGLGHGASLESSLELDLSGGDNINHVVGVPLTGGLDHGFEGSELIGKVVLGGGDRQEGGDGNGSESHNSKSFLFNYKNQFKWA